jgi:mannose-6-phosphate isomerase-like protein (cupin superfamily)
MQSMGALGAVHRLENPGKVEVVLIEVQTVTYLGEDDILRYEDVYART